MIQIKFGGMFAGVGAGFQDWLNDLGKWVLENEDQIKNTLTHFAIFAKDLVDLFNELGSLLHDIFAPIFSGIKQQIMAFARDIQRLTDMLGVQRLKRQAEQELFDQGKSGNEVRDFLTGAKSKA